MTIFTESITESFSSGDNSVRIQDLYLEELLDLLEVSDVSMEEALENISFLEEVSASSGKSIGEIVGMLDSVSRQATLSRSSEETLGLISYPALTLESQGIITCPANINDTVSFELYETPATNIEIKLPDFGDVHSVKTSNIINRDIYIRRDLHSTIISMDFSGVTDKTSIVNFYNACRGILVKFTDQYNNTFLGFLNNDTLSVNTIFESKCDLDGITDWNDYGFNFTFEGKRTSTGAL